MQRLNPLQRATGKANTSTDIPNRTTILPARRRLRSPRPLRAFPASRRARDRLGMLQFWSKRKQSQGKKANRQNLQINLIRTTATQKIKHLS